jgi:hypothetical protein
MRKKTNKTIQNKTKKNQLDKVLKLFKISCLNCFCHQILVYIRDLFESQKNKRTKCLKKSDMTLKSQKTINYNNNNKPGYIIFCF